MTSREKRPPYTLLSILMIGAFITFLSNTLLNVAMPVIMNHFDVSEATVQWLQTGYMLINGIIMPSAAFFIQKYTTRQLFFTAMGLFTLGTVVSGFAPLFEVLLVGRMTQAAGAAIMMPLLMNIMLTSFPPGRRGTAMGVFGLVMMFAPAIGPTLSGWIIQHFDWTVLFKMVAPFAILILILGWFKLHDEKETVDITFDVTSLILSALGFGGILYGLGSAGNKGWQDPVVYGLLLLGVAGVALFIWRQFKLEKPMLDFRVYRYSMYSLSTAIVIILNIALFSGMLMFPLYLQNVRGFTPLDSGLIMLPGALLLAIMSPVTGRLFDRYGARSIAIIGISILVITSYLLSKLTTTTPYLTLIVLYAVRMMGISMVMMPVTTNGLNTLPAKAYPHGTAMNNTIHQVSGALGGSLLISVMANRAAVHAKQIGDEAGLYASGSTSQPISEETVQLYASLAGMNDAYFLSAIIAGFALVLAFFIKKGTPQEEQQVKLSPSGSQGRASAETS